MADRPLLVDPADLVRSIPGSDTGPVDDGLLQWAIETVSGRALAVTGRLWRTPAEVPSGAYPILNVAARRLYVNPDRYTREAEGDYSYGLDASVTKAAIFTADEEAALREYAGEQSRPKGIGTMSVRRGDVSEPRTVYVPDGTRYGFPWWAEGDVV